MAIDAVKMSCCSWPCRCRLQAAGCRQRAWAQQESHYMIISSGAQRQTGFKPDISQREERFSPSDEGWGSRFCRHRSLSPLSVPRQTGNWSSPWLGVKSVSVCVYVCVCALSVCVHCLDTFLKQILSPRLWADLPSPLLLCFCFIPPEVCCLILFFLLTWVLKGAVRCLLRTAAHFDLCNVVLYLHFSLTDSSDTAVKSRLIGRQRQPGKKKKWVNVALWHL